MRIPTITVVVTLFSVASPAAAQLSAWVTDPAVLAGTDAAGTDRYPRIATDGNGHWVAVWHSTGLGAGTDWDILVSRSVDNGATWTDREALNTNADDDDETDWNPRIATDGTGNWVVVWQSRNSLDGAVGNDWDILVARSSDHGVTWTDPAPLNGDAGSDDRADAEPEVATDGAGTWVAAWQRSFPGDTNLLVAHSSDEGATWTDPVPLNSDEVTDGDYDHEPQIAADGAGMWVAVWESWDSLDGAIGTDSDILIGRSWDEGASWTFGPLDAGAAEDGLIGDADPHVATDGAGNWVAVWQSIDGHTSQGDDWNILTSRSSDNGLTWATPEPLNTNAATDSENDYSPRIATDGAGRWVTVWYASELYDSDHDIFLAVSQDNGTTWTDPEPLNTNAATDDNYDWYPQVATSGAGHWIGVWHSQGGSNPQPDILYTRFAFCDLRAEGSGPTLIHFPPPHGIAVGLLSDLRVEGGFVQAACLGSSPSSPSADFRDPPPVGDGWYYLARGDDHCPTFGPSNLVPDPRDELDLTDPCP